MTATCWLRACAGPIALTVGVFAAQTAPAQDHGAAPTEAGDGELEAILSIGEQEYLKNCRACHGTRGTAGVPLAGNGKVSAGFDYLTWAIITGPGYMPEFGEALSDDQIAQISTYILNNWGNSHGIVSVEDIRMLR